MVSDGTRYIQNLMVRWKYVHLKNIPSWMIKSWKLYFQDIFIKHSIVFHYTISMLISRISIFKNTMKEHVKNLHLHILMVYPWYAFWIYCSCSTRSCLKRTNTKEDLKLSLGTCCIKISRRPKIFFSLGYSDHVWVLYYCYGNAKMDQP